MIRLFVCSLLAFTCLNSYAIFPVNSVDLNEIKAINILPIVLGRDNLVQLKIDNCNFLANRLLMIKE